MKANFVPDRITVYDPLVLAASLRSACIALPQVGRNPGDMSLAVLMAQIALETGRGKSCHGWNLGNIKASKNYEGQYSCFRCNEIIRGKVKWFSPDTDGFAVPPGHPQTRFRAYEDAPGLKPASVRASYEYVAFLAARTRYAKAWKAALAGDPAAYVHELKIAGYFTASEGPYARAVVSLVKTYLPSVHASHSLNHVEPDPVHQDEDDGDSDHSATSNEDLIHMAPLLELPDWKPAAMEEIRKSMLEEDMEEKA